MVTRSAKRATTARSWLIRSIAVPASFFARSRSSTWAWTVTSRAVVGSSAISRDGRAAMAEAMSARCRSPPDSSCAYCRRRSSGCGMPTSASSPSTRSSRPSRVARPCTSSGSATSSPTRRSGSSELSASCRTYPMCRPRSRRHSRRLSPRRSRPSKARFSARTAAFSPASPSRVRAVTLLPDPDSPTRATHSPARTERLTSRTAWTTPWRVVKSTDSPAISTSGRPLIRAPPPRSGRALPGRPPSRT